MLKTRGELSNKKIYTACVQLNLLNHSEFKKNGKIVTTA